MYSALSASTRRLDDFASLSTEWFWETDENHRFVYFSARLSEVMPVLQKTLIGQTRDSLTTEDTNSDKWIGHWSDLRAHRPFRDFEYEAHNPPNEEPTWVRISGKPIFDDTGNFRGYRGVSQDVTVEKRTIARLEASNGALALRNQQLDEARCALERSVMEDILTSAWNRRAFERDLQDVFKVSNRRVGLMHIDLDRFKWVNDTCGHPAGDIVLQTAATRIRLATGGLGTVYRVGGDEFMVLLCEHVTRDIGMALGRRITDSMTASVQIGQRSISIGASIGVAFSNTASIQPHGLASQADIALYKAKQSGRNDVCIVDDTVQNRIADNRKLAADIPRGLSRGEFVPYFQPQMNIATGEVIGAEVLVRWQHPTRGVLEPAHFLKSAIEQALIEDIDRDMLRLGLAAVRRIRAAGYTLPSLSVNTSEARLMDPRLPSDIGCHWLDPSCSLSFELLETIYFDEVGRNEQFHSNLRRIRDMGVRIETDDFGSGRASLTGLLQVAPDRLKIDRGLVNEIVTSSSKRSMVRAILDMANALGIDCMAEGAESPEAVEAIRALGCVQVQGYAIAHPLSEDDLLDFLKDRAVASDPLGNQMIRQMNLQETA